MAPVWPAAVNVRVSVAAEKPAASSAVMASKA